MRNIIHRIRKYKYKIRQQKPPITNRYILSRLLKEIYLGDGLSLIILVEYELYYTLDKVLILKDGFFIIEVLQEWKINDYINIEKYTDVNYLACLIEERLN